MNVLCGLTCRVHRHWLRIVNKIWEFGIRGWLIESTNEHMLSHLKVPKSFYRHYHACVTEIWDIKGSQPGAFHNNRIPHAHIDSTRINGYCLLLTLRTGIESIIPFECRRVSALCDSRFRSKIAQWHYSWNSNGLFTSSASQLFTSRIRSCYAIMRNVLLQKRYNSSNKSCIRFTAFQVVYGLCKMRLSLSDYFSFFCAFSLHSYIAWESNSDLC